ncbi:MAG TPA: CHAD domain-containing protein [Solirubrobacteraceae bacterium]|nr:CHAD domain-containing protein [Solirubrobacteraceae bacterium]
MTRGAADYLLPDRVTPRALRTALAGHFELESEPGRMVDRAYFDTFEGLLRRSELSLLWEDDRLQLLNGDGREVAGLGLPCAPEAIRAAELPPGALRDRLAPVIHERAATALVRMRARRRPMRVLDSERKTVVRLNIEAPSIVLGERARTRLAPRLTVVGVRGYDKALGRVRGVVEGELGLVNASAPLADEAVAKVGGIPSGVSSNLDVVAGPRQRADDAAVAILTQLTAAIEANMPGTLADVDSEFLHDLRVSVRRIRSLLRELDGVFPPVDRAHFRAEFRWLQEVTGPTRDLDVYLLDFDAFAQSLPPANRADLDPLHTLLSEHRWRQRRRMVRALRSQRTRTLLLEFKQLLAGLPELPEADRPDAAVAIVELAGRRIATVYRAMVKMGTAIDDQSPPVALHDLRKKGKELRYLLEFFGALFPPATVAPMLRTLKSLQDTLGRFQDREIQAGMLCSLADETATLREGAAALMAMGVLVQRLTAQQAQARREFAQRFAPFADRRRQGSIKETFA